MRYCTECQKAYKLPKSNKAVTGTCYMCTKKNTLCYLCESEMKLKGLRSENELLHGTTDLLFVMCKNYETDIARLKGDIETMLENRERLLLHIRNLQKGVDAI